MTSGNDGAEGGVRHAAESLRAALDDLRAAATDVDKTVRDGVMNVTGAVERAARIVSGDLRGDLLATAHQIRLHGTEMTAAREDAFAAASHILGEHADEIEALLRAAEHGTPTPVFSVSPPPDPPAGVQTTVQDAATVQRGLPDEAAHRRATNQIVSWCPPKLQDLVRRLLFGYSAHAVQRHGHHLSRDQMIARAQWCLDPAGIDGWQDEPDGSVRSLRNDGEHHRVGATAGHYASPEAFAKPLITVLQAAGRTQAALDRYLNDLSGDDTFIRIFLQPSVTGIVPGDVLAVRGPGTDTVPGEKLWLAARKGSMAGVGSPPQVRDHDLVASGRRTGSVLIFARRPEKPWRLVTGYFLDDPNHKIDYTEL